MVMTRFDLLGLKMQYQEDYAYALETENRQKATFLRGKITAIEDVLKIMEERK
jgi:hypothetical protein